jgi:hypothetical protein
VGAIYLQLAQRVETVNSLSDSADLNNVEPVVSSAHRLHAMWGRLFSGRTGRLSSQRTSGEPLRHSECVGRRFHSASAPAMPSGARLTCTCQPTLPLRRISESCLAELAPQVGLEPTTLRLTAECRCLDSRVLRAGSSDGSLLLPGVRQNIVQRLCRADSNPWRAINSNSRSVRPKNRPLLVEVEHVPNRSVDYRDHRRRQPRQRAIN